MRLRMARRYAAGGAAPVNVTVRCASANAASMSTKPNGSDVFKCLYRSMMAVLLYPNESPGMKLLLMSVMLTTHCVQLTLSTSYA